MSMLVDDSERGTAGVMGGEPTPRRAFEKSPEVLDDSKELSFGDGGSQA
jgi:hypothetical protein